MKDPAFLFYSGDFLVGVTTMTMEERGQYITLLCLQHQKGHLSEKDIRKTFGIHSVSDIPDVIVKFNRDESGLYYNHRLEAEIAKRASAAEAKRVNGAMGGRPKTNPKPELNLPVSQTETENNLSVNESVNENENENKNGNETKTAEADLRCDRFDAFWAAYPKKYSKGAAEKAWQAIDPGRELLETMLRKLAAAKACPDWTKESGQYIPYPATWLRARGWEDEIRPIAHSPPKWKPVAEQMYNQRYYDPAKYAMPFTPEELEEIRRVG